MLKKKREKRIRSLLCLLSRVLFAEEAHEACYVTAKITKNVKIVTLRVVWQALQCFPFPFQQLKLTIVSATEKTSPKL